MSVRRRASKGARSMNPDTTKTTRPESETTGSRNRIYRAEIGKTEAGSPIVKMVPLNPKGPLASHRQVAAFIY